MAVNRQTEATEQRILAVVVAVVVGAQLDTQEAQAALASSS
jgi:hypothetical protein